MSDTTQIKKIIEPYVRKWLASEFPGHEFKEASVSLKWGRNHKFDAVSEDGSIVVAILSNGAKTRGGKENTGGVRKAESDLLRFHGIDDETTKIMVFTDAAFLDLINRRTAGLGIEGLRRIHCKLPEDLESKLQKTLSDASKEQRAGVD